jgi:hypothetical protein
MENPEKRAASRAAHNARRRALAAARGRVSTAARTRTWRGLNSGLRPGGYGASYDSAL